MMKLISTKVHGVVDYLTVSTLLVLPRTLSLSKKVTNLLTGSALGMLGYSALTRYELGLFKVLPMKRHLLLDLMSGGMLAAAPFLLLKEEERSPLTTGLLTSIGVFEIVVSRLTQAMPTSERSALGKVMVEQIEQFREAARQRKMAA